MILFLEKLPKLRITKFHIYNRNKVAYFLFSEVKQIQNVQKSPTTLVLFSYSLLRLGTNTVVEERKHVLKAFKSCSFSFKTHNPARDTKIQWCICRMYVICKMQEQTWLNLDALSETM